MRACVCLDEENSWFLCTPQVFVFFCEATTQTAARKFGLFGFRKTVVVPSQGVYALFCFGYDTWGALASKRPSPARPKLWQPDTSKVCSAGSDHPGSGRRTRARSWARAAAAAAALARCASFAAA